MKVVQINAVYEYSSTGRNTQELHEYLLRNNHESYVFCTNYSDPDKNITEIGDRFDYKVHALCSRIFGLQGYFSRRSTGSLLLSLGEIKPDVVLLGNLHANFINIPLLFDYLARNEIPTILVLHDCWFFTGHCCHYTEDKCYKWKVECHHCPILNKYNKSLFFDRSRKIFRDKKNFFSSVSHLAVVGVSDWITNEARLSPIFPKHTIFERIYNWIDLNVFYPRETFALRSKFLLENRFIALGVSQEWNNQKGLPIFIKVAKHFPDITIILIGKISSEVQLPANVLSVGVVSDLNLLAEFYSMADVFLNFSIQETFGKVAAEALACGTPLIVNNKTANPELVGDCGFCIQNNNLEEIFIAIEQIKHNKKDRYRAMCVERARSMFEKEKNLGAYLTLMKEI